MAMHNLSIKLNKEIFRGMNAAQLIRTQRQIAETEIEQAKAMLHKLGTEQSGFLQGFLRNPAKNLEEFKAFLNLIAFEKQEANLQKFRDLIQEREDYLKNSVAQEAMLSQGKSHVIGKNDALNFWVEHQYELYMDHTLDMTDLESSKVDFYAVSRNRKVAFFILLELNRNAPESNVLKLYYYLKNTKTFWNFEDIVILQVFSPKYMVEKKGKSLSLAREMSNFLGQELFTGVHSFGEQKVRINYYAYTFGEPHYEIYSVFWKLMADEADEETRFELMCNNLPTNKNFLSLCAKYVEREQAKNKALQPWFHSLIQNQGKPEDILRIFQSWCMEILHFVEHNFIKHVVQSKGRKP